MYGIDYLSSILDKIIDENLDSFKENNSLINPDWYHAKQIFII